MTDLELEERFFKEIPAKVTAIVSGYLDVPAITLQKGRAGDFATELDLAVESLIVAEIKSRFSNDLILAEEGFSDTEFGGNRTWIIDPICGTNNASRGIRNFCTNIALSSGEDIIASCVIDHSTGDYIWSVGGGVIFINEKRYVPNSLDRGTMIELDLDSMYMDSVDEESRRKYIHAVNEILKRNDYIPVSLSSSLNFTNTAIGRVDGFINASSHIWDIAAGAFLVMQSGGTITDLQGNAWHTRSVGAIAAGSPKLHSELLGIYSNA